MPNLDNARSVALTRKIGLGTDKSPKSMPRRISDATYPITPPATVFSSFVLVHRGSTFSILPWVSETGGGFH
jgi:hypothetical protein